MSAAVFVEFARQLKLDVSVLENARQFNMYEFVDKIIIVINMRDIYKTRFANSRDFYVGGTHIFEYIIQMLAASAVYMKSLDTVNIKVKDTSRDPIGLYSLNIPPPLMRKFVTNYKSCFLKRIGPVFWTNVETFVLTELEDPELGFKIPNLKLLAVNNIDLDSDQIASLIEHFPGVIISGLESVISKMPDSGHLVEAYKSQLNPLVKCAHKLN